MPERIMKGKYWYRVSFWLYLSEDLEVLAFEKTMVKALNRTLRKEVDADNSNKS